ncbi:MAG: lipopolysaccharide biosynthesis protein [Rubrivivax sp.]
MSIAQKAFSALKWATVAKLVVQITSWAGTLVVVRLLSPEDYGLMAKVAVVCSISAAIAELGLGAAIVRSTEVSRDDLRRLSGASLLFGFAVTAAVVAASPLLALLFREPRLVWPIAFASLQILIASAALVPSAMATRDLGFKLLATTEMAAGFVGIVLTLALAFWGAGVWALVLGTLGGALTRTVGLLAFGERTRPTLRLRGIGEHLKFGLTLVGNRVSYFIVVQADVVIGSAFLTTTEIGQYSVALQLATLPMSKVMGTINQITMPVVARQQHDLPAVRESVLRSLAVVATFAFPVLWGISALAPEIVAFLFGDRWLAAVMPLQILPLIVPVRMISSILFTTSLALGNRQLDLRNSIANFVLIPLGFFVGSHWGILGLCLSWLVALPLTYGVSLPGVVRAIGLPWPRLLSEVGLPALATAAGYGAVTLARPAFAALPSLAALLVLSLAGGAVFMAVMAVLSRRHLAATRDFVRAVAGRAPAEGAAP